MKRIPLILMLAALFISYSNHASGQDAGTTGPKIACDEPTYNFGDADSSQDVSHTFVLRNEGDQNLEISNVKPSCGCTVANITTRSIPPGGESLVTTKLALRGRQGQQRKGITVSSNDPKTPSLMLYIEGECDQGRRHQPAATLFWTTRRRG